MMIYKFRKQMKWIIIAVIVAFAGGALYFGGEMLFSQPPEVFAVAKVNGDDITEPELNQAYLNYVEFSREIGQPVSAVQEDDLRYQALQDLVDRQIMRQVAQRERIRADERRVEEEMERIKQSLGDDFADVLRREGFTERTLRDRLRSDLVLEAVFDEKSAVHVDEEEVRRAYEASRERVDVRHILIEPNDEGDWDAAFSEAEQLIAQLDAGADFAQLATAHSADEGSKDSGGEIGLVSRDDPLVPEFLEAAFSLDTGAVSEPVRTVYGYHIIQVTERHTVDEEPFEEVSDALRADLEEQRRSRAFAEWIDGERERADVAVLEPSLRAYQLALAGRFDQAIDQYKEAIFLRPNDPYLVYRLAMVFDEVGAVDEALDAYVEAAEKGIVDPFLWFAAGSAYQEAERFDEAKDAYINASEFAPGAIQLHQLLAIAFDEMGFPDEALQEQEKIDELQSRMLEEFLDQQSFLDAERELLENVQEDQNTVSEDEGEREHGGTDTERDD